MTIRLSAGALGRVRPREILGNVCKCARDLHLARIRKILYSAAQPVQWSSVIYNYTLLI